MSVLYEHVVEAAYSQVKKLVGRPGVFLLAPPGSSRGYILERLLREGAVDGAYAYPRLAEELRARGLAVGDLPSAEGWRESPIDASSWLWRAPSRLWC